MSPLSVTVICVVCAVKAVPSIPAGKRLAVQRLHITDNRGKKGFRLGSIHTRCHCKRPGCQQRPAYQES